MAGRDSGRGVGAEKPGMTAREKWRRRAAKMAERDANRREHWENRKLAMVARNLAKEVPEFANASKILAEIEDVNEHLTTFMQAGVAVLGESFPELVQQSVEKALDQYDEDGNVVREGDATERRFLIQKMIDLKPLVEGSSFKSQAMKQKIDAMLSDPDLRVTATERQIEFSTQESDDSS